MRNRILLLTHGGWGEKLLVGVRMIIGSVDYVDELALTPEMTLQEYKDLVADYFTAHDVASCVIMVDMFGGTPGNVAAAFSKDKDIDVICGLNAPLLIDACMQVESEQGIDVAVLMENTADSIFDLKQKMGLKGGN